MCDVRLHPGHLDHLKILKKTGEFSSRSRVVLTEGPITQRAEKYIFSFIIYRGIPKRASIIMGSDKQKKTEGIFISGENLKNCWFYAWQT